MARKLGRAIAELPWRGRDLLEVGRLLAAGADRRADPRAYGTGTGRPVVVVPGVYETWHFVQPLMRALHEHGHPVFTLPELGSNRRPIDEGAALLAALLETRDLRDVLVVAHSKGGLIGKYAMMRLDPEGRIAGLVAIATPFSGSRLASWAPNRTLRAFRVRHPLTRLLAEERAVNARITSIYPAFDPVVPEGSDLPGARTIELPTGGHFTVLRDPRTLAAVLEAAGTGPGE